MFRWLRWIDPFGIDAGMTSGQAAVTGEPSGPRAHERTSGGQGWESGAWVPETRWTCTR